MTEHLYEINAKTCHLSKFSNLSREVTDQQKTIDNYERKISNLESQIKDLKNDIETIKRTLRH